MATIASVAKDRLLVETLNDQIATLTAVRQDILTSSSSQNMPTGQPKLQDPLANLQLGISQPIKTGIETFMAKEPTPATPVTQVQLQKPPNLILN